MIERRSISQVEGKGILRRLTKEEAKKLYPSAGPYRTFVGFITHGKIRLTFDITECFDENGNYFSEVVE